MVALEWPRMTRATSRKNLTEDGVWRRGDLRTRLGPRRKKRPLQTPGGGSLIRTEFTAVMLAWRFFPRLDFFGAHAVTAVSGGLPQAGFSACLLLYDGGQANK